MSCTRTEDMPILQAHENLREERHARAALQQQLAQLQEAGQASAQALARLEAQSKQLGTQLQHSQATSHTLQKLIQVSTPYMSSFKHHLGH